MISLMLTIDDADYIVKTLNNIAHLLIWLWGGLVGMLILMSVLWSLQLKRFRDDLIERLERLAPNKPEASDVAET